MRSVNILLLPPVFFSIAFPTASFLGLYERAYHVDGSNDGNLEKRQSCPPNMGFCLRIIFQFAAL